MQRADFIEGLTNRLNALVEDAKDLEVWRDSPAGLLRAKADVIDAIEGTVNFALIEFDRITTESRQDSTTERK